MKPFQPLPKLAKPDAAPETCFEAWRAMLQALDAEFNFHNVHADFILRVEPPTAMARGMHDSQPHLALEKASRCRRLQSFAFDYFESCRRHPTRTLIRLHVLGLDHLGHLYVTCAYEKPEKTAATPPSHYAFTFEAGWSEPAPLYLMKDIQADRWNPTDVQAFRRKTDGAWLDEEEIAMLARGEAVVPGFELEVGSWPVVQYIEPLLKRLKEEDGLHCHVFSPGAPANYFDLFVFSDPRSPFDRASSLLDMPPIPGLRIYFCLSAPIAVMARGTLKLEITESVAAPIAPADLLAPHDTISRFERKVVRAIQSTPYALLTSEEVARPLPEGVHPFGRCHGPEPWHTLFHALFSYTG